ncbi:MAG: transposase, partial [Gammaproteobacteria bacterium]|nr:transposase [Gammaproteobacteria bacterium]
MSRPPRIEFPGACYHVKGRAPTGRKSFKDRTDYNAFLNVLDSVAARFGWLIHSYALLENHYHLVVEVPHSNLSRGMRQLNGVYTQHYNRRHLGEGPVFRGRFKSIVFEKDLYLLAICLQVLLNPFRISGQASLEKYRFGSYLALIGEGSSPDFS